MPCPLCRLRYRWRVFFCSTHGGIAAPLLLTVKTALPILSPRAVEKLPPLDALAALPLFNTELLDVGFDPAISDLAVVVILYPIATNLENQGEADGN